MTLVQASCIGVLGSLFLAAVAPILAVISAAIDIRDKRKEKQMASFTVYCTYGHHPHSSETEAYACDQQEYQRREQEYQRQEAEARRQREGK